MTDKPPIISSDYGVHRPASYSNKDPAPEVPFAEPVPYTEFTILLCICAFIMALALFILFSALK